MLGAETVTALPQGVYYYRMEATSGVVTRRMIVR
jgi:hypothetical protein